MSDSIMNAYSMLYTVSLIIMGIILILCLIKAIIGPRIADRLIAINMMGTTVVIMIAILSFLMNEGYLIDVAIVYTMLSFLAVVLLAKIYMGVYRANRHIEEKEAKEND